MKNKSYNINNPYIIHNLSLNPNFKFIKKHQFMKKLRKFNVILFNISNIYKR